VQIQAFKPIVQLGSPPKRIRSMTSTGHRAVIFGIVFVGLCGGSKDVMTRFLAKHPHLPAEQSYVGMLSALLA
jgi:hypothetical protein